jgi:hypothetical protein
MSQTQKSIAVLTSGGDAPGMNAAVRAVVRAGINKGMKVYGVYRGYNGLLNGDVEEMNLRSVSDIIGNGGTMLYTARSEEYATPAGIQRAADFCRSIGVSGVVVIGGDGSFRGARCLTNAGINCIGVPGTIDNDIACSEYTVGFDTAEGFYKILNHMGAKVIFNHADFRLMSKRALNAFSLYKETNIFLRGMVPMIGFKSDIVTYERSERLAGESKYPLKKMLALAWEGITSLSIQPIRIITWLGAIVFGISLIMIIYSLISFFCGWSVSGWSSLLCSIWAIGGLQLLAIGVIGEYIGKIYMETKRRPRFIVDKVLDDDEQ